MIHRYANQAASDAHLATKPVQDLIELFTTGDVLSQPPEVHNSRVKTRTILGSPLAVFSDPAIVLVSTTYKAGSTANVSGNWEDAAQEALSKGGDLNVFIVAEDKESNSIRAEYVLKSWDAFEHFASRSTSHANFEAEKMGPTEVVKIRPIDGFIGREDKSKL